MKPECIKTKADEDHHLENHVAQSEIQTADQTDQPPTIELGKWTQPRRQRRPQLQDPHLQDQHQLQAHSQRALIRLRTHTPRDSSHPPRQEEDKLRVRQPQITIDLDQSHTPEMHLEAETETETEIRTDLAHKIAMTELPHPDHGLNPDPTPPEVLITLLAQAPKPLLSQLTDRSMYHGLRKTKPGPSLIVVA